MDVFCLFFCSAKWCDHRERLLVLKSGILGWFGGRKVGGEGLCDIIEGKKTADFLLQSWDQIEVIGSQKP